MPTALRSIAGIVALAIVASSCKKQSAEQETSSVSAATTTATTGTIGIPTPTSCTSGSDCPSQYVCCAGRCTMLNSTDNCGACGVTCSAGQQCLRARTALFTCTCTDQATCPG